MLFKGRCLPDNGSLACNIYAKMHRVLFAVALLYAENTIFFERDICSSYSCPG